MEIDLPFYHFMEIVTLEREIHSRGGRVSFLFAELKIDHPVSI